MRVQAKGTIKEPTRFHIFCFFFSLPLSYFLHCTLPFLSFDARILLWNNFIFATMHEIVDLIANYIFAAVAFQCSLRRILFHFRGATKAPKWRVCARESEKESSIFICKIAFGLFYTLFPCGVRCVKARCNVRRSDKEQKKKRRRCRSTSCKIWSQYENICRRKTSSFTVLSVAVGRHNGFIKWCYAERTW